MLASDTSVRRLRFDSPTVLWLLVGLGVVLRLIAYAAHTSLRLDEILLSRNILDLPLARLVLEPLQLDQVAPRGFLAVERIAVVALGRDEFVLRLFPFLCGLAALLLYPRLARRTLDGLAIPIAVALVAFAIPFIKYGTEVKQYICDATVAVVLLSAAVTLHHEDATLGRRIAFGALAFVVIWFSQASVVMMGGIGVAFAIEWLVTRNARTWGVLTTTIPMWGIASLVAVVAGLRSMTPSTREFMDDFWHQGFLPRPTSLSGALAWLWNQSISAFSDPTLLVYPWAPLFAVLAVIGVIAMWRRERVHALIVVAPLAMALIAAIAHQYPLRGRLMFYLMPSLLLAVASGISWLGQWT
ncbi:MAG: hypothetical protein ABIT38_08470, partial [Gemmatimonadaceae bacterium]